MLKFYVQGIFVLFFLSIAPELFSQNVGINSTATSPSTNAILDLNSGNSNNLGLIIPNVSLTALNTFDPPIANASTAGDVGMMVYNTNATVGSGVGYYCWEGPVIGWVSVTGSGGGGNTNACGTAATGYLPYFTSSSTICNSILYEGSPTTLGIGTITPKNMLDINGSMAIGSYAGTNAAPGGTSVIAPQQAGIGTPTPNASALLDLTSTTQGLLTPRMSTAQIAAITSPAIGLVVYNLTTNCFEYNYNGTNTGWVNITGISGYLSPASLNFNGCTTDLITIPGLSNYTTIVWSAPTTICSAAVIAAANLANASSLTLSGETGGTGVVTATVTTGCGTMTLSTSAITFALASISLDNSALGTQGSNVVSITTSGANEVVLLFVDGWTNSHAGFTGSVAITGGSSSGLTQLQNTETYASFYGVTTNTAVYAFVAATAATYTCTVTETGMLDYLNTAIALKGFCNTATVAGNVVTGTAAIFNIGLGSPASTITNSSINPTIVNSYIAANFCTWEYSATGTVSWPAPSGNSLIGTTYYTGTLDLSYDGYSDPSTGPVTFTVQDAGNIALGNLQVIEVHN